MTAPPSGLETEEALAFLTALYDRVKEKLNEILTKRERDRSFIDERIKACAETNTHLGIPFTSPEYITPIGLADHDGRVVFGPVRPDFHTPSGQQTAPHPAGTGDSHVTLFGPPDSRKMAVNAMNCFHRRLPQEPPIVEELLSSSKASPEWGADLEDSKTPIHRDMVEAAENLTACIRGDLTATDEKTKTVYSLKDDRRALPYKRFPGLALPCGFLFYRGMPLPLHLYDFALHLFHNRKNPKGLFFYVPKLENDEEAAYIKEMIQAAEEMIQEIEPGYETGSVRLMIVLENPRALFRVNEIMDALYPYFLGASLGWHDYLASSARLFKEDSNYRIPVKADPGIVIKHIKSSHELLSRVVGNRGGVCVGGMYGILPLSNDKEDPSFQVSITGFFKDVITQLKRGLKGFWVAHPDFVRIGIAITEAWELYRKGSPDSLYRLVDSLLSENSAREVRSFIEGDDITGLSPDHPGYIRDLVVARLAESDYIKNNDPREIGFNVFQTLQYLADWLRGNGCVALPAEINGIQVRIMDDLATTERSRWEVWHEIRHGRISIDDFLQIALDEYEAIQRGENREERQIQVHWDEGTAPWYPVAFALMCKLMTDPEPAEFATELLLPFTLKNYRGGERSFDELKQLLPGKFALIPRIERYLYYYRQCGSRRFAREASALPVCDFNAVRRLVNSFKKEDILEAASHHGNIGDSGRRLKGAAAEEQKGVLSDEEEVRTMLREKGKVYRDRFGFKYLVSAKGRTGRELLENLEERISNSPEVEINNAREALWQITEKRISAAPPDSLVNNLSRRLTETGVPGISIALSEDGSIQTVTLGTTEPDTAESEAQPIGPDTCFDIASLSKSLSTAFAMEALAGEGISIDTPVSQLLDNLGSPFRLSTKGNKEWIQRLSLRDCMSHRGLNMHYVNAIPLEQRPASVGQILKAPEQYGYEPVSIITEPGTVFNYSGAGFMVLEHIIDLLLGEKRIPYQQHFVNTLGLKRFFFDRSTATGSRAIGCFDDNRIVSRTPHWFPSFAAGCVAAPLDVLTFLLHLGHAYHAPGGSGGISHDTAVEMLHGSDGGAVEFMGLKMGLGVFTGAAGPNKIAVHQGANEGYRAVYLYCYDGPDRGKGFAICANGDNRAVPLIARTMQDLLFHLEFRGIDRDKFSNAFNTVGVSQEEIVNRGYKELVFEAFEPALPEAHPRPSTSIDTEDPLLTHSILKKGTISAVSDQSFGRASNLISPLSPVFDPGLFGSSGKIVDSWETARHNSNDCDRLVISIPRPFPVRGVYLSTAYHKGNQAGYISLEAQENEGTPWIEIVPKIKTGGHSECALSVEPDGLFTRFKIKIYPDGGLTRAALFSRLPPDSGIDFSTEVRWIPLSQKIPEIPSLPVLPVSLIPPAEFRHKGINTDYASAAAGAYIEEVSNEHYSPAASLISPFPPLHMFDGLETARSRDPHHYEEVVIRLGSPIIAGAAVLDFTWFKHNNPRRVILLGFDGKEWQNLSGPVEVKPFAGNVKRVPLHCDRTIYKVKLQCFPDGGMNRIHIYAKK